MKTISTAGVQRPRTTSEDFDWPGAREPIYKIPFVLELLILLSVGVLAAVLHKTFRIPLHMPGYHGMEWFALLLLARLMSDRVGAGMLVALGAASTALVYAGGIGLDGKSAQILTYLLQGFIVDALIFRARAFLPYCMWVAAVGAIAHMLSPLTRNLISSFSAGSIEFGSLVHGLGYPLATHGLFGATGATAGLLLYLAATSTRRT